MARSEMFAQMARSMRIARLADARGLTTTDAVSLAAELAHRQQRMGRRSFVKGLAGAAAAVAGTAVLPRTARGAKPGGISARIAIIGGGMAGLVCADTLRSKGISATVYEAHPSRLGGRVASTHAFPGQVAERGGELIDNLHKTVIGYANEFGLTLEDVSTAPGDIFYHTGGQRHTEAELIDEWRVLVGRVRPDLHQLGAPTFFAHTEHERLLDTTDLATYLDRHAYDLPIARAVLDVAYNIEYGREIHEQSCLNLLTFIHFDRRSKFRPWGVFSDERYHVVEGNDRIPQGIADRLGGQIVFGHQLRKLARDAEGTYQLWFDTLEGSPSVLADAVVLAVPFSVLRAPQPKGVLLDPSLGLTADKLRAIETLPYGTNTKTMIGFQGRPWAEQGCNGTVYSDLSNLQNSWETSWTTAGATSVLTDYSGGERGLGLQTMAPTPDGGTVPLGCSSCHQGSPYAVPTVAPADPVQAQADAFLTDLDVVLPGAKARATRVGDRYLTVRGHWTSQRHSLGSYTCPQPGYFTEIAGLEGQPADLLKFAGEHANSFYEWQGFMEGAALSGVSAASELLEDIKRGRLG